MAAGGGYGQLAWQISGGEAVVQAVKKTDKCRREGLGSSLAQIVLVHSAASLGVS